MLRSRGWVIGVALITLAWAGGCGDKEKQDTTPQRTVEPEPERPTGPPKKLMPPELRSQVEREFKNRTGDLERCYNDYVVETGNKKLRGTIIIAVTIGWRKNPSKVWFLKNEFKAHPKLTECFLSKIRQWEFPTWGGEMDYSFRRLTLEEM